MSEGLVASTLRDAASLQFSIIATDRLSEDRETPRGGIGRARWAVHGLFEWQEDSFAGSVRGRLPLWLCGYFIL